MSPSSYFSLRLAAAGPTSNFAKAGLGLSAAYLAIGCELYSNSFSLITAQTLFCAFNATCKVVN